MSEPSAEALMEAHVITRNHIARVNGLLTMFAEAIRKRGAQHDASKFDSAEMLPLARMQEIINREGHVPFGSPAYLERKKMLGPMLRHHYEHNSHHPEHYTDGVADMDLLDLCEMFFDWKAASERSGARELNLSRCCETYQVNGMLANILFNTARRLQWKVK